MPKNSHTRKSEFQKDCQSLLTLIHTREYYVSKLYECVYGGQHRPTIALNLDMLRQNVTSIREVVESWRREIDISSWESEMEVLDHAVKRLDEYLLTDAPHMSRPLDGILCLTVVEKQFDTIAVFTLELQSSSAG